MIMIDPSSNILRSIIREGSGLKRRLDVMSRNLTGIVQSGDTVAAPMFRPGFEEAPEFDGEVRFLLDIPGSLGSTVSRLFSLICALPGVVSGGLYLFDDRRDKLDLVCHQHIPCEMLARLVTIGSMDWHFSVFRTGQKVVYPIREIPAGLGFDYEKAAVRNLVFIPLRHQGALIGCMCIASADICIGSDFEPEIAGELTVRISHALALYRARVLLKASMCDLRKVGRRFSRGLFCPLLTPVTGQRVDQFLVSLRDDLLNLCREVSSASKSLLGKPVRGRMMADIPYSGKLIDRYLSDIGFVMEVIARLKVFATRHDEILGRAAEFSDPCDQPLICMVRELLEELKSLAGENRGAPSVRVALRAGKFAPLPWPLTLDSLKFRPNRLTTN